MLTTFLLTTSLFTACEDDESVEKQNAEIIAFNPAKCGSCWGWSIKKGNDTIKSDDADKLGGLAGYDTLVSIPVYIELGDLVTDCSNYDYYEVISIEKID